MAWLEWTIVSVLVSLMEMLTWVLEAQIELASLALSIVVRMGVLTSRLEPVP
jgi:hypothetical protein